MVLPSAAPDTQNLANVAYVTVRDAFAVRLEASGPLLQAKIIRHPSSCTP